MAKNHTNEDNAARSARGFRWQIATGSASVERGLKIRKISPFQAQLVAQRFNTLAGAQRFINPQSFEDFMRHDFAHLCEISDLEAAATRLADAVEHGERIGISGDYDCDGNCSTALFCRFLLQSGVPVSHIFPHIPNRKTEGYGVNQQAVGEMLSHQVSLLVTLDNGTLSFDPIRRAAEAGMSIIVADHHPNEVGQSLPSRALVVNPNRHDDTTAHTIEGARDMAAVGVTFMLCTRAQQLLQQRGYYTEQKLPVPDPASWLGLVALATIGDVVNVATPINRMLVTEGLSQLAGPSPDPAIRELCDVAQLAFPPDSETIGFRLAPIINSAGRLGQSTAWAYLSGFPISPAQDSMSQARHLMMESVQQNEQRKQIEAGLMKQASAQAATWMQAHPDSGTILVAGEGWHEGLIGIVAGRLKEQYQLPVVVASINPETGNCKCSARSTKVAGHTVDIGSCFRQLHEAGILDKAGGHPMAAGASFKSDKLETFRHALETSLGVAAKSAHNAWQLPIAGVFDLASLQHLPTAEAEQKLVEWIQDWQALGPFAEGNAKPRILIPDIAVSELERIQGGKHIRLHISKPGLNGLTLDSWAFHSGNTALEQALNSARQPTRDPITGKRSFSHAVGTFSLESDSRGTLHPVFMLEDIALPGTMAHLADSLASSRTDRASSGKIL